jgi:endonuclease/exonuclease/phosphatase family metal-dependent hydrolase
MRLLSYNIHGCIGRDGVDDPERIVEVIREIDADVVALQEVDEGAEGRRFADRLTQLGYAHIIYGPTMTKQIGEYGNLLMSRLPVESIQKADISESNVEPRGAIAVDLQADFGRVRLVASHLGLKIDERRKQWQQLLRLSQPESPQGVSIIIGDMNEWWPHGKIFKRLTTQASHISSLKTFPAVLPLLKLDRVVVFRYKGEARFRVAKSAHARVASDHLPLVCDLAD